MDKKTVYEAALRSLECGISVVPPAQDGTKRPDSGSWKQYQEKLPTESRLESWYASGRTGVGWVTGKVSGNLEVIDFDDRTVYEEFRQAAKAVGLGGLVERIEAGYLEHSPNGAHWAYYCKEISCNTKLARKPLGDGKIKTLIETKGEGGYIIVAPTFGSVNRSGSYKLVRGRTEAIIHIEPSERAKIIELARTFDLVPAEKERVSVSGQGEGRPGDDYASKVSWSDVLSPHGWTKVHSRGEVDYWRRPGKSRGVSATTGHAGNDYLHVFSTSTSLPDNKSMGKFSVYAKLEHGGDYSSAARELALLGYGETIEIPDDDVDVSALVSNLKARERSKEPPPADKMSELMKCPGLIGDLSRFINETSPKPQPVLALAASIAAMATVIGRKVMLPSGLRPNLYILGVGETGCGKERARQAIRSVFAAAGIGELCQYDDIASDAGITSALFETPSCLFLLDEFGRILKAISNDNAPSHLANQVTMYLKLYGASEGVFYGKTYADSANRKTVDQPSLCIYGTTVPGRLNDALTSAQVTDGLLSRFLVFESDDPDPDYVEVEFTPPPESVVERFRKWGDLENGEGNLENICSVTPRTVPVSFLGAQVYASMESDLKTLRIELRASGEETGLYTRIGTMARKLGLIRACGVSFESPEITESDAEWGVAVSMHLADSLSGRVLKWVADNQNEADTKWLLRIIRKAGRRRGITRTKLTRKTQRLKRQERRDMLDTLYESGQIKVRKSDKGVTTYTTV